MKALEHHLGTPKQCLYTTTQDVGLLLAQQQTTADS